MWCEIAPDRSPKVDGEIAQNYIAEKYGMPNNDYFKEALIAEMDKNKDDMISFVEFRQYLHKLYNTKSR